MCGIYGSTKIYPPEIIEEKLNRIAFRGPDFRKWQNFENKVIFGHNRLAIIDLDVRSSQPFSYDYLKIVYNGEVYNYQEIKKDLIQKGYKFRTTSDTEVLCAAYVEYGQNCVNHFNGMFAFVIYDSKNQILFGARDRLGQKPFYYSLKENHFEFASQPSQIKIGNLFAVNEEAISQYLRWKYIPEPNSAYQEISKLKAGHSFTYDINSKQFKYKSYWDLSTQNKFADISYEEAKFELKNLISDAVSKRMMADVPLGVFLSGGIDSSLVTSMAQHSSKNRIKTFSIKFQEKEFDESKYAQAVAKRLGTNHTEISCNPEEGIELIQQMNTFYDEPFADSSAIPSMLLAKHTRKHVTVALSGDAGDESFIGYNHYSRMQSMEKIFHIPPFLRRLISLGFSYSNNRRHKEIFTKGFNTKDIYDLYYQKRISFDDEWIKDPSKGHSKVYQEFLQSQKPLLERLSDFDLKTYLVDDINTKVDRATMAFSLEARAPLLDYRVVEYARRLPTNFKWDNGNKKRILKDILYEYLPKEMFNRPKTGFAMPFKIWFRGVLKEYVLDNLSENNLKNIPNIKVPKVLELINLHMGGKENNYQFIWMLLMLNDWLKNNK